MSLRQVFMLVLASLAVAVAAALWWLDSREFRLRNSSAGSFLAAYQAGLNKDYAHAGRYYGRAQRTNPDDVQILREGMRAHLVSGNINAAARMAEMLLMHQADNPRALMLLLVQAFKNQQYDQAQARLESLKPGPMSTLLKPNLQLWLALAQEDTEARMDAINKLEQAPSISYISRMQAGLGLEIDGDVKNADRLFKIAVSKESLDNLFFTLAYGGFLQRQGKEGEAEKIYTRYQASHKPHPYVTAAAKDSTAPPINRDPVLGMAGLFMAIGATMRGEGQYEPAFVYSHLADYLAPNDARVIFQIAELLDAQKMWVEAAVWYNQIERGDPLFIEAQIHRAHALDDLGLHEKAIGGLSDVLEADGEARDVLVAMGDLLRMNERFAEAESAYDRAIATIGEEQKPFWHIYFARGICHERLGDWERAEIDLQKARELSDGEPHVLNYLGYSWIDQGIYLREGLKIIQQAVKKKPSNGAFRDSLGWAYYRLGKYNEALSQLEYASRLEPLDPIITDHLGDVLWQLGRKVEARYQWSKALAFEPEEKDRVKIEAKLITGLKSKSSKGSRPVKIPRGGTAI